MKIKPSILTIYAIFFLVGCIGYTIYNYDHLSEGEGWGIVGMVALFGFGALLLVSDIVIHNIIKNKTMANVLRLIIMIIATLAVIYGDQFS